MKKALQFMVMLAAVAVCITSCSNNASKLTRFIPKDASVVAGIDAKGMTEKLAKGNMDIDTIASLLSGGNDSSEIETKWNELKSSGIDLSAELYVFGKQTSSIMEGSSSTMGVLVSLKDVSAFEQFIKKKKPGAEIKTSGDYSYVALGDDYIVGWKDKVAILDNVHGGKNAPGTYNTGEGTLSQLLLTKLFAQGASESIESVDAFKDLEKEQGDILFYSAVSSTDAGLSALSLSKMGDLIADSYTTGTINFEDGKVVASFTGTTSKVLGQIFEKYPGHSLDAGALDKYPLHADGFMSLSFNPRVLAEIVKYAGAEDMANQALSQYSLTIDDVVKALKGDITVAVTANDDMQKPQPGMPEKSPAKFIFNAAIGDKASYDKVVKALNAKGVQVPQNGVVAVPMFGNLAVSVTDKNLVVASDIDILQKYLSGTSKGSVTDDVKSKISGKSVAFYADINAVMQKIKAAHPDSTASAKDSTAPFIKDFIATGDKLNGKTVKGDAELRMLDESQNSLVTIVRQAVAHKKAGKTFSNPWFERHAALW